MIKIINCNKKNYLNNLTKFLDLRRSGKKNENKTISKILKDIKNNKNKSLLKYEKKFSKNSQIKPNIKQIDKAIKCVLELISAGNAYVDTQAPWTLKKTNKIRMEEVLYIVTNIIIKSAIMLYPIIPVSYTHLTLPTIYSV